MVVVSYYQAHLNSVDGKVMHSLSSLMQLHDFHGEIGWKEKRFVVCSSNVNAAGKDFPFTSEGVQAAIQHLGSGGKPVFAISKRKK